VTQSALSAFIWSVADQLRALVAKAKGTIDLLKERRGALISAAVTGQIDVRCPADAEGT
jgi:type I restriction enzyme S subunit